MPDLTPPIAIDLFSGAGGMSLGFRQAGFQIAASVDFDSRNVDTYSQNFPGSTALCADLGETTGRTILEKAKSAKRQIDVLFGGPPCQGFSLIGNRQLDDPRNKLLFDFARLVAEIKPRYFVFENVVGLSVGETKRLLNRFLGRIEATGYQLVLPWRILDAAEYGVPQRRRRLFILGARKGLHLPNYPTPIDQHDVPTVWDAIGDLPEIDQFPCLLNSDGFRGRLGKPSSYASIMRGLMRDPRDISRALQRKTDVLTGCKRTLHSRKTRTRFRNTRPSEIEPVSRYYRLPPDGLANTLRAGSGKQNGSFTAARPIHPTRPRCVSVRESARLHSFPDWFQFHPTKWHALRQIGNAVPPFLARAVALEIRKALAAN